jgi:uncharacterized membrane protein YdfJ with MMPL/SSD domain
MATKATTQSVRNTESAMSDTQPTSDSLLAALRQAALSPSLSRANFEALKDAVHLIEDQQRKLTDLLEPMSAIVYWHDQGRVIDESWWDAARAAVEKANKK